MKLDRREILKLAAGAALARPVAASAAPGALAPAVASQALPAKTFFSAAELALLDAVSEVILPADDHSPGARAAGVAGFVDAQLATKDPNIPSLADERRLAKEHLAALDAFARDTVGKGFAEATREQQEAVLTKAAAGEHDPKTAAEKAFKWAKTQTASAYYSSKIGIHQEMEYKGNSLLVEFVGEVPK